MGVTLLGWLATGTAAAAGPSTAYFPSSLMVPKADCQFGGKVVEAPILSAFEANWYSGQLRAADEPLLSPPNTAIKGVTVRFTWLRSFHAPIVVRLEGIGSDAPRMIAKQLSGEGGYAPGRIAASVNRPLNVVESETVQTALAETPLVRQAGSASKLKECGPPGTDGAEWVFEMVDSGGYHFAKEWSPGSGGLRHLGLALLALTGWKVDPIY